MGSPEAPAMGPVLPRRISNGAGPTEMHKQWRSSYLDTQAMGLVLLRHTGYGAGPTETHKLWGWYY